MGFAKVAAIFIGGCLFLLLDPRTAFLIVMPACFFGVFMFLLKLALDAVDDAY
jgi:hypothetical protein